MAGHETRKKMPVRGFYKDPSPGVFGLDETFNRAAKSDPAQQHHSPEDVAKKTAALLSTLGFHSVKAAADKAKDPIKALVNVFRNETFGLKKLNPDTQASAFAGDRSVYEATTPVFTTIY